MSESVPLFRECNVIRKGHHKGPINAIKFDTKGNYCLTCGQDSTVKMWNPFRNDTEGDGGAMLLSTYAGGHGRGVVDIDVARDNRIFSTCGNDKVVILWDVATQKIVRKFWDHDMNVNSARFNNLGSVLVTASSDCYLRAFDCRSRSNVPLQKMGGFKDNVTSVLVSDTKIIGGSMDGTIRTYDIRSGQEHVDDLGDSVISLDAKDGKSLLVGSLSSKIRMMDMTNGSELQTFTGHRNEKYKIGSCLTNTGSGVLSGSEDGSIYVWGVLDGKLRQVIRRTPPEAGHSKNAATCAVSYHPQRACFLSCAHDGTAALWTGES